MRAHRGARRTAAQGGGGGRHKGAGGADRRTFGALAVVASTNGSAPRPVAGLPERIKSPPPPGSVDCGSGFGVGDISFQLCACQGSVANGQESGTPDKPTRRAHRRISSHGANGQRSGCLSHPLRQEPEKDCQFARGGGPSAPRAGLPGRSQSRPCLAVLNPLRAVLLRVDWPSVHALPLVWALGGRHTIRRARPFRPAARSSVFAGGRAE